MTQNLYQFKFRRGAWFDNAGAVLFLMWLTILAIGYIKFKITGALFFGGVTLLCGFGMFALHKLTVINACLDKTTLPAQLTINKKSYQLDWNTFTFTHTHRFHWNSQAKVTTYTGHLQATQKSGNHTLILEHFYDTHKENLFPELPANPVKREKNSIYLVGKDNQLMRLIELTDMTLFKKLNRSMLK